MLVVRLVLVRDLALPSVVLSIPRRSVQHVLRVPLRPIPVVTLLCILLNDPIPVGRTLLRCITRKLIEDPTILDSRFPLPRLVPPSLLGTAVLLN